MEALAAILPNKNTVMGNIITDKNTKTDLSECVVENIDILEPRLFNRYPDLLIIVDQNTIIERIFSNFPKDFFNTEAPETGKPLLNYLIIEEKTQFKKALRKAVKTKKVEKIILNSTINGVKKIYDARLMPSDEGLVFIIISEVTKSKIAEEALKLSELRFRSIWENSIDGMCMVDLNGIITGINKSFSTLFEIESKEVIGKDFSKMPFGFQDYGMKEFLASLQHNPSGRVAPAFHELKAVTKSGKSLYLEMFNIVIDSLEEEIYEGDILNLCIIRDISERKIAEEVLRESEKHYRTLVETSPDAIILMDSRGVIVNCNRQVYELFSNTDTKSLVGSNIIKFVADADKARVGESIKDILTLRKLRNVEFNIIASPDKTTPVEINASLIESGVGASIGIIAVVRDISAWKAAQSALVRSEMQFRSVWEHSHDGMRLTDENGRIIAVNPAYASMVGIPGEKLIGRLYFDVYEGSAESNENIRVNKYKECFRNRDFKNFFTARPKLKSGQLLDVDVKFSFIEHDTAKLVLLSIFRDIAERTKAEESLRNSEKLASIGKMAAYISHEIRTPLASIGLNLEMLYRDLVLPPKKQRNWNIIHREIIRLNNMVKNILLFSKNHNDLLLVRINLRNLINATKDLLGPTLKAKNINIINRIVNLEFMADYQRLQTVILHLVENSIESIGQNGDIEIYSEEDNTHYHIYFKDNGIGIECASRIFEPFYTTKHSGTGLGLSIIKKIMESHNGNVTLVNAKMGETIFCLSFLKQG